MDKLITVGGGAICELATLLHNLFFISACSTTFVSSLVYVALDLSLDVYSELSFATMLYLIVWICCASMLYKLWLLSVRHLLRRSSGVRTRTFYVLTIASLWSVVAMKHGIKLHLGLLSHLLGFGIVKLLPT